MPSRSPSQAARAACDSGVPSPGATGPSTRMSRHTSRSPGIPASAKTAAVASPLSTWSTAGPRELGSAAGGESGDGAAGEGVHAVVHDVAAVAAHLVPDDVVAAGL